MADGSAELVVILTQGALATAQLTSRRATLEELLAAGIDPSDPANQNIERFEILVGERRIGAYRRSGGGWIAYFNGERRKRRLPVDRLHVLGGRAQVLRDQQRRLDDRHVGPG